MRSAIISVWQAGGFGGVKVQLLAVASARQLGIWWVLELGVSCCRRNSDGVSSQPREKAQA